MMKYFIKISLLFYFSIHTLTLSAQKTTQEQIKEIEYELELLQERESIRQDKFEVQQQKLDAKYLTLKNELKEEYQLLSFIIYLIFPVSVIGTIIIIYNTRKRIKQKAGEIADEVARKKIDQYLETVFKEKKSTLIEIINQQNEELQLRKQKRILVLTPKGQEETDEFLKGFFAGMGFDRWKVTFMSVDKYQPVENTYDLIFANNEKGGFTIEREPIQGSKPPKLDFPIINEYFNQSDEQKTALFYFNTTRHGYNNYNVSHRVNFASSRIQIYANLINTLKYQDKVLGKR